MSELIKINSSNLHLRWRLLATVSMAAMVVASGPAFPGEDGDRPTVWIELGGQLQRATDGQEIFEPPFLQGTRPDFQTVAPQAAQKAPKYMYGGELAIAIQPQHSEWVFSAQLRYGRSNGSKHYIDQTNVSKTPYPPLPQYLLTKVAHKFVRSDTTHTGSNTIADFQVGRDVGLGLLGNHGDTTISLGVRYAQFSARSTFDEHERPDYGWKFHRFFYTRFYHNYGAHEDAQLNSHGVGPSLSLRSSSAIARTGEDTDISLDWGINGAVLFGRQHASVHHSTSKGYFQSFSGYTPVYRHQYDRNRSRTVTIPNAGGFAGLSFRYADAKLSLGYRADFFFGAMDGGVDNRNTKDQNFYGPYASIGVTF